MQAELSTLKSRVVDLVRGSAVGERVGDVVLETDRYDDGGDFLRVILEMKSFDGLSDADLAAVIEAIERAVGELDERYPSVRFADAA